MTVTEVLQWVDNLVFAETDKHLDDLQELVIKGVWENQTYQQIAEKSNRSESHIRDVGYKLWKILSDQLGEKIQKSNFCSTFERLNLNSPQIINIASNHNCNYNPQILYNQKEDNQENINNTPSKSSYSDLSQAPQIIQNGCQEVALCDRTLELETLSDWLNCQNIRLISVLGLSGIGKSLLVRQLVDLNLQAFEVIIWKNLKLSNSFDGIITDILTKVNPDLIITQDKLSKFLELLKSKRCLIILDNIEELFMRGKFAGIFKTKYKGYQDMLRMITEIEHQSTLILISQEQCSEMGCLEDQLYPIQCLELKGLYSNEIMEKTGLQDLDNWDQLINLYEGNPVYLKDIVYLINNIFGGKVSDFLAENTLFIPKNMQCNFKHLFDKLSSIEQQIVLALSKFEQSVSREKLRQNLELSSMDLINGLQSLQQRYLITKIKKDKILFSLNRVFREYVSNFC